jgi:hypothetical protein
MPVARGGKHCIDNVWVVDAQINAAKGTMTVEEFLAVCRDVVDHQTRLAIERANTTRNDKPPAGTGGEGERTFG